MTLVSSVTVSCESVRYVVYLYACVAYLHSLTGHNYTDDGSELTKTVLQPTTVTYSASPDEFLGTLTDPRDKGALHRSNCHCHCTMVELILHIPMSSPGPLSPPPPSRPPKRQDQSTPPPDRWLLSPYPRNNRASGSYLVHSGPYYILVPW